MDRRVARENERELIDARRQHRPARMGTAFTLHLPATGRPVEPAHQVSGRDPFRLANERK